MEIAHVIAKRATCDRKHVGAVIVDTMHRIVSTGYNGAPKGMPHCDDVGHLLKEIDGRQSCIRTLHAESNALDDAGRRAAHCAIYVTVIPCYDCAKRIIHAGIKKVVYGDYYASRNTDLVLELFREADMKVLRADGSRLEVVEVEQHHSQNFEFVVGVGPIDIADCLPLKDDKSYLVIARPDTREQGRLLVCPSCGSNPDVDCICNMHR